MNKITYLTELENHLKRLPRDKQDNIMFSYEQFFYEKEQEGLSESAILKELDKPKLVAKRAYAKHTIHNAEDVPTARNIMKAVIATLGISLFTLCFVVVPMFFVIIFMVLILLISLVLLLSPAILVINIFLSGVTFGLLSNILFSLSLCGLGIVFMVLVLKVFDVIYGLTLKYLRWNIKMIRGGRSS
ncbi:HAAS signaling domain-containing protein [Staphylococcus massiliensis]|uniref:DUF1700 domain-containing protein n=1 Tax=Staphylococcus massiliensis S46 TaxID=1229783 RepID=K9AVT4_9STAP|nr:DUF1700 domain-containing protein [Staphylococcus massiliensis]EKU45605.1 hypothetical protein C273_11026 [Staphylococcus massiliensis S46]MCG3402628.1 DUF1700 domain-containing protein [Staphylococcus massiliensis]PNZ97938.1 DUF1700 domain-containing protein [Staphylococcus massiliensis CCUG 55927]